MLLLAIFILTIPIEVLGMLLRSSAVQIPTAKGMQTVHETIKRINRPPHVVINTVLDFNSWSKWISPGSQFISDIPKFSKVGQSCREVFGLFGSSYITWTAVHLSSSEVRLVSSGSQGTFGWEDLTLEFSVEEDNTLSPDGTLLNFKYSWTVSNKIVAFFERSIIRHNMMAENVIAMYKLSELCEQVID